MPRTPLAKAAIMIMILASCVNLAADRPRNDPSSLLAVALRWIELSLNMLFAIEMLLKLLLKVPAWMPWD